MVVGIILFSFGIVNIFSSLLLFLGGYIAIKNTFDYRLVKKNMNKITKNNNSSVSLRIEENNKISEDKVKIKPVNMDNSSIRYIRRYSRVRRRY